MIVERSDWQFNAEAKNCHGFAIFIASIGALRTSRSGAVKLSVFNISPPFTPPAPTHPKCTSAQAQDAPPT